MKTRRPMLNIRCRSALCDLRFALRGPRSITPRMAERTVQSYKVLVGMEVHVQLATASKMFTGAANGFGGEPNAQVDPVVLGLPGVLPVMNRGRSSTRSRSGSRWGAGSPGTRSGTARATTTRTCPRTTRSASTTCRCAARGRSSWRSRTARSRPVRIRRAHLEEDAGKLLHEAPGGYPIDGSIVDLNRAGTPLLEIVTEPDLSDGRGGGGVRAGAAEAGPVPRRQPRADADGPHAVRAEHQRPHHRRPRHRPQDGHHRDQEPEQLQRPATGDGLRGAAAASPSGSRPGRSAARAPTGGTRRPGRPWKQRDKERPTTTATSPTPTWSRSRSTTRG